MSTDFLSGSAPTEKIVNAIVIESVARSLVGKSEAEALAIVQKEGFRLRVRSRDGIGLMGSCDARKDRINATVERSIIVRTSVG